MISIINKERMRRQMRTIPKILSLKIYKSKKFKTKFISLNCDHRQIQEQIKILILARSVQD